MRLIYFHLLRFCTANQYLDLGVPLNQIDNAHDGIDCFLTASDPYVNSCSVHRGSISQVTVVNPIYEIRKPRMGRSLWSVDHDFRSVHQLIQCIPEILIIIIHLYILRQTGIVKAVLSHAAVSPHFLRYLLYGRLISYLGKASAATWVLMGILTGLVRFLHPANAHVSISRSPLGRSRSVSLSHR